jgi:hypothetical protein
MKIQKCVTTPLEGGLLRVDLVLADNQDRKTAKIYIRGICEVETKKRKGLDIIQLEALSQLRDAIETEMHKI